MPPKRDIGWDYGTPVGDGRKNIKCKFCDKVITGGITRLKQHIAHVIGNIESCKKVPKEVSIMMKKHLKESKVERELMKRKKEKVLSAIRDETISTFDPLDSDSDEQYDDCEINEEDTEVAEAKQLRNAMRESRKMAAFEEEMNRRRGFGDRGAGPSQGPNINVKRGMPRSFSTREKLDRRSSRGIDSYMLEPKQKSIKNWFAPQKIKAVGKAITKFFLFNAIPFHAADSGPYYQSMINIIAEAGPGISGPSGRQIGGIYLEDEVEEINGYITTLKTRWPEYGCTIMCDGWSTRNKHPIINFMIYCDRKMIFHSSVDCTNKRKSADLILSLLNKIIDEVGEENVVQVVTDSESANKATREALMLERPHLFWSPCAAHCIDLMLEDIGKMPRIQKYMEKAKQITSFIYNSDKLVNLMKIYTNDRELLRPGITRFATQFIAVESLIRHQMCTTSEWVEYNSRRIKEAEKVCKTIMDPRFWKGAREVQSIMEPLVRVLKLVDQDKKPTLAIIYEAMDRAKLAIKETIKDWKIYWDVIDDRWYRQLHHHLHAAAYFLNPTLQYSGTCVYSDEVRQGLKIVIKRLEPDINAQAQALNEIKLFRDRMGEFGTPLAKSAVKNTLPAEWWINYGDEAPHLRKIAIKVLSQTCSSTGCERNWSTWSLIHTKLRNRLAIEKLHKLVFVHYNIRLRMRNFQQNKESNDYDLPIDLNHIFNDDDILNEWTKEKESPLLVDDDLEWLDKEINSIESEEDDNPTLNALRLAKKKSGSSQSRQKKGKKVQTIHESDDTETTKSDDENNSQGPNDDSGGGGGQLHIDRGGNEHSQRNTNMSWAQGDENYYATQDTDHGYRPGIEAERRFLAELSSMDDHSQSAARTSTRRYRNVDEHMQNLGLREYQQNWPGQYFDHVQSSYDSNIPSRTRSHPYDGRNYGNPTGRQNTYYDYSDNAHIRYQDNLSSSNIGYRGSDYGSFGNASSLGHQRLGYYGYSDESSSYAQPLNNAHSSNFIGYDSSSQLIRPLHRQRDSHSSSNPYVQGYLPSQFNNSSEADNYDFVPPRHSTWY